MPYDLAWCIVGDLIQGIGTVVIAKPEGDMRKYFATLERLIALNPRVIIPSHGMALGTVYRLEETLKHRRQREQQVLSLWREGKDLETKIGRAVVEGKSVSVRVDLGGRRLLKKKTKNK